MWHKGLASMKLLYLMTLIASAALAAEKKVKLEELPPAVQAAVREQTKNAALVGVSAEKEKGKTFYEVETKVGGKSHDLLLDQTGAVVQTEDEIDTETVPASAKSAIQKRAAGGTISKVEKVTTGTVISYEAVIRTKAGKTVEYAVNADGTPHREN
jgi:uncharacterized membrane protein YkoI